MASPRFRIDFPLALTFVLLLAGAVAGAAAGVVSQPTFTCYTTGDYKTCYVDRQECSTSANFTAGSQYQANLLKLLADLPPAAISNGSFAETTAGSAPDRVFGLAMCYADRNLTQCQDCLRNASGEVQQRCPLSREAKISRDACILRYSNLSFFSDADRDIVYYASTEASLDPFVGDAATMSAERRTLMAGLVPEAASSSLRFANGSKEYTDSQGNAQVIYGLAQCTRDLNDSMCRQCLKPNAALIAGVTVGSVAFIFICTGILVSLLLRRRRRRKFFGEAVAAAGEEEALEDDEFEEQAGPRRFRYSELEAVRSMDPSRCRSSRVEPLFSGGLKVLL